MAYESPVTHLEAFSVLVWWQYFDVDSVHVKERVGYALFPFKVHTITLVSPWHTHHAGGFPTVSHPCTHITSVAAFPPKGPIQRRLVIRLQTHDGDLSTDGVRETYRLRDESPLPARCYCSRLAPMPMYCVCVQREASFIQTLGTNPDAYGPLWVRHSELNHHRTLAPGSNLA